MASAAVRQRRIRSAQLNPPTAGQIAQHIQLAGGDYAPQPRSGLQASPLLTVLTPEQKAAVQSQSMQVRTGPTFGPGPGVMGFTMGTPPVGTMGAFTTPPPGPMRGVQQAGVAPAPQQAGTAVAPQQVGFAFAPQMVAQPGAPFFGAPPTEQEIRAGLYFKTTPVSTYARFAPTLTAGIMQGRRQRGGTIGFRGVSRRRRSAASSTAAFIACTRTVSSIVPNTGTASMFIDVTIGGGGFVAGDTVQIVSSTLGSLAVSNVAVVSPNSITATVLVDESSALGSYDVRVIAGSDPNCIGVLANGFTVV